jgi:hypothetical protein
LLAGKRGDDELAAADEAGELAKNGFPAFLILMTAADQEPPVRRTRGSPGRMGRTLNRRTRRCLPLLGIWSRRWFG